ncbi:MAG: hypothetical protein ACO207_04220, partial [Bacilli bacterium]
MKKIWPLTFLIVTVTSCVNPSVSSSSSSGVPNGRLPLTPVEGCGVQTIDNQRVCTWTDEFNGENLNLDD